MNALIMIISCIVTIFFLSSCTEASRYSGDGKLVDNGPLAANDRYVLDLGKIDLNKKGVLTYKIKNLPSVNFVVGIEIRVSPEHHALIESKNVKPIIFIELLDHKNVQVMHNQSSLDTWTWSVIGEGNTAFVYGENQSSTFFTPIANRRYELRIVIVKPDSSDSKYEARILAKSGGWK